MPGMREGGPEQGDARRNPLVPGDGRLAHIGLQGRDQGLAVAEGPLEAPHVVRLPVVEARQRADAQLRLLVGGKDRGVAFLGTADTPHEPEVVDAVVLVGFDKHGAS